MGKKVSFQVLFLLVMGCLLLAFQGCLGAGGGKSFVLSGRVTDSDGQGMPDVILRFKGAKKYDELLTDGDGYWSKRGLSGPVTVTPFHSTYSFDPPSVSVSKGRSDVNFTAFPQNGAVIDRITKTAGAGRTIFSSSKDVWAPHVVFPENMFQSSTDITYTVLEALPFPTPYGDYFEAAGRPIRLTFDKSMINAGLRIKVIGWGPAEVGESTPVLALYIDGTWLFVQAEFEDDYLAAYIGSDLFAGMQAQGQGLLQDVQVVLGLIDPEQTSDDVGMCLLKYDWDLGWYRIYNSAGSQGDITLENDAILLVHGIFSGYKRWDDLAKHISSLDPDREIYAVDYGLGYPLDRLGEVLAEILKKMGAGGVQIDVVAHSQGGLISRSAMEIHGAANHVKRFVSLGTPHEGVFWGVLLSSNIQEIFPEAGDVVYGVLPESDDLQEHSDFLSQLNGNLGYLDVDYYFIAGTGASVPATDLVYRLNNLPIPVSDSFVELSSAEGRNLAMEWKRPVFHKTVYHLSHCEMPSSLWVFQSIEDWLNLRAVVSDFSRDDEGWRMVNTFGYERGSTTSPSVDTIERIPQWIPVHRPEINYIGGKLRGEDWADGMFCWKAPEHFTGDLSAYYQGTLEFRLEIFPDPQYDSYCGPAVILCNSLGDAIVCDQLHPSPQPNTYLTFEISLESRPHAGDVNSQWHHGGLSGPEVSEEEFRDFLADVELLLIRGDYWRSSVAYSTDGSELYSVKLKRR